MEVQETKWKLGEFKVVCAVCPLDMDWDHPCARCGLPLGAYRPDVAPEEQNLLIYFMLKDSPETVFHLECAELTAKEMSAYIAFLRSELSQKGRDDEPND